MNVEVASPFHAGELAVQSRVGVREYIAPFGQRAIRKAMPEQHREFFQALPFAVMSARDNDGRPWATILAGKAGFLHSPQADRLEISALPNRGDALHGALKPGAMFGLLGIEFSTRRRNRMNGTVISEVHSGIETRVDQSFGNCPQYIATRSVVTADNEASGEPRALTFTALNAKMKHWIERADTAFIASGIDSTTEQGSAAGMDVSHRGGPAGFVEVRSPTQLVIPDYAGNKFFNTLGNVLEDPRTGLLFVDFNTGSLLQLSGRTTIDWHPGEASRHSGAQRLLIFNIDTVVVSEGMLPLRWAAPSMAARHLVVEQRRDESADVVSFQLKTRDGGKLPTFRAGQHLPIFPRIGNGQEVERNYSLTNDERDDHYRIAVKRLPEGVVSQHLHAQFAVGDTLLAGIPSGEFGLPTDECPIVLTSAGIGITPLMALLHSAKETDRSVDFVHVARDGRHHPFADEVRAIVARKKTVRSIVAYSQPSKNDRQGFDYDIRGRFDASTPATLPTPPSAHHFVCGPTGFVNDIVSALEERGVDGKCIHVETF